MRVQISGTSFPWIIGFCLLMGCLSVTCLKLHTFGTAWLSVFFPSLHSVSSGNTSQPPCSPQPQPALLLTLHTSYTHGGFRENKELGLVSVCLVCLRIGILRNERLVLKYKITSSLQLAPGVLFLTIIIPHTSWPNVMMLKSRTIKRREG